ncbi:hypothetical protein Lfu02_15520 [Longispora fulva]|nr:hypothetical protein Lfu02_15520 [Longispora fulva]
MTSQPTTTPTSALADLDGGALRWKVRTRLRAAREAAGLTQAQTATRCRWSTSKQDRIENGHTRLTWADTDVLARVLGVPDPDRRELLDLIDAADRHADPWSDVYASLRSVHRDVITAETTATRITVWALGLLPELVQAREYATATSTHTDPDRWWDLLAYRQHQAAKRGLRLDVLADETTVYRADEIQRQHLLRLHDTGRARIRIVPITARTHPGLLGGFGIYHADIGPVLHWHDANGGTLDRGVDADHAIHQRLAQLHALSQPVTEFCGTSG